MWFSAHGLTVENQNQATAFLSAWRTASHIALHYFAREGGGPRNCSMHRVRLRVGPTSRCQMFKALLLKPTPSGSLQDKILSSCSNTSCPTWSPPWSSDSQTGTYETRAKYNTSPLKPEELVLADFWSCQAAPNEPHQEPLTEPQTPLLKYSHSGGRILSFQTDFK